jgi:hypothetical protein
MLVVCPYVHKDGVSHVLACEEFINTLQNVLKWLKIIEEASGNGSGQATDLRPELPPPTNMMPGVRLTGVNPKVSPTDLMSEAFLS